VLHQEEPDDGCYGGEDRQISEREQCDRLSPRRAAVQVTDVYTLLTWEKSCPSTPREEADDGAADEERIEHSNWQVKPVGDIRRRPEGKQEHEQGSRAQ